MSSFCFSHLQLADRIIRFTKGVFLPYRLSSLEPLAQRVVFIIQEKSPGDRAILMSDLMIAAMQQTSFCIIPSAVCLILRSEIPQRAELIALTAGFVDDAGQRRGVIGGNGVQEDHSSRMQA